MFRAFHRNFPHSVRQKFDEALPNFHSLSAHYLGSQWTLLRGHMLLSEVEAHFLSGEPQDEARSRSAIELLACSALVGHDHDASNILITPKSSHDFDELRPIHPLLKEFSVSQRTQGMLGEQIDTLYLQVAQLSAELPIDDHPMFRPEWTTLSVLESDAGMSTSALTITVHYMLPQVRYLSLSSIYLDLTV
jgi:hypothetical protein